jgi:hypothetical protein
LHIPAILPDSHIISFFQEVLGVLVASTEIDRRVRILDYLLKNATNEKAKINKADVMRHLESVSRLNTTHRTIVDLIDEGKINIKQDKDNPLSQTHYLKINENNPFNKIYNVLLRIENHIDSMNKLTSVMYELRRTEIRDKRIDIDESTAGQLLGDLYRDPYESAIDKMLHFFLLKISELHLDAQDSEILYRKIARLFLKMLSQRGIQDLKKSTNQKLNYIVNMSEVDIKRYAKFLQKYAKTYASHRLDFGVRDDLLKLIKDFQEEFLV